MKNSKDGVLRESPFASLGRQASTKLWNDDYPKNENFKNVMQS